MFDHVSIRVPDLPEAVERFQRLLDPLSIDQSVNTRNFAMWGDLGVTEPDEEHPLTHRAHIAFVAPTTESIHEFWQRGLDAGMRDDGPPGPRPDYSASYYGAFLLDERDNSFEAVVRDGHRRGGNIDHVKLRVADLAASSDFYRRTAAIAGLEARSDTAFTASGGLLALAEGPPTAGLHIAFRGDDESIRRFYEELTAAGYRGAGEPGERPRYHAGYYAAYVLDPDGNNIEVVDHHR